MNEFVSSYIEKKQEEIRLQKEAQKKEKLIKLGIFEKIYQGEEGYDPQEACYEWNAELQSGTYYNRIPVEVTDEEYEEILKLSNEQGEITTENNPVAAALKFIAWAVYAIGFIMGIIMGNELGAYNGEFNFGMALACWLMAFIGGTLFLGFSEIIKLLHEIKYKI